MKKSGKISTLILIAVVLAVNIALIHSFGTQDMVAWIRTISVTLAHGPQKAFGIYNLNYPPLASLFLWIAGRISHLNYSTVIFLDGYTNINRLGDLFITVKFAILFFYTFFIALLFLFLHKVKRYDLWKALLFATLISANIALIEASMALSYIDIFYAPFLFLSVYFLSKRQMFWSGFMLATSFSIKIFPILLIPVFLAYCIDIRLRPNRIRLDLRAILWLILGIIMVVAPQIAYYGMKNIEQVFSASSEHGSFLSFNAANLGLLLKYFFYHDNISSPYIRDLLKISFFTLSALFVGKLTISKKTVENFLYAGIGVLGGYFTLYTGVHENHLFPALILAISLVVFKPSKKNLQIYFVLSLIIFSNLFLFYGLGLSYGGAAAFFAQMTWLTFLRIALSFVTLFCFSLYITTEFDLKRKIIALRGSLRDPSLVRQLPRFLAVGGIAFMLDTGIYFALTRHTSLPYLIARTISVSVSLVWSFLLNRVWTFEKRTGSSKKQALRFLIVMATTSSLNLVLMKVGVGIYHLNDLKVLVVAAIIITGLNFFGHRLWSFEEKRVPQN